MSDGPAVRCVNCELVQFSSAVHCRRCHHQLPAPIVQMREVVVEEVHPVITLAEAERIAIRRALKATNGRLIPAAELLEIGRTTIYRKVEEMGGVQAIMESAQ